MIRLEVESLSDGQRTDNLPGGPSNSLKINNEVKRGEKERKTIRNEIQENGENQEKKKKKKKKNT